MSDAKVPSRGTPAYENMIATRITGYTGGILKHNLEEIFEPLTCNAKTQLIDRIIFACTRKEI